MSTNDLVFTQRLTMHLNGGSKYSELHYDVFADGKQTAIKRFKGTNGSPKYLVTADIFVCGDESFNNLAARGIGLLDWLCAHHKPQEVTADA
jgi:hypothetical protein